MNNEAQNKLVAGEKEFALESIISSAVQIPGVKVERQKFLADAFASQSFSIQEILDLGPVEAGVSQDALERMAHKLILKRTSQSSAASFVAGIPGGLALAATIPADVLQFFGMSLRLAQELAYLYGADDLWKSGQLDDEAVNKQLLLYCGVMFGVAGAVSGVRVMATQAAAVALKKIPQKALTKTFWYPILKQIGRAVGLKVTKDSLAKGVSKAVPVLGGVISGGMNFYSMMPMANRLRVALDSASFGYTQEELEKDIIALESISLEEPEVTDTREEIKNWLAEDGKKALGSISGFFSKQKASASEQKSDDVFNTISRLAELNAQGIITQEEFEAKKAELLSRL